LTVHSVGIVINLREQERVISVNEAHVNLLLHVTSPPVDRGAGDSAHDRDDGPRFRDQLSLLAPPSLADPRGARRAEEPSRNVGCSPCEVGETNNRNREPIDESHGTPQHDEINGRTEDMVGQNAAAASSEGQSCESAGDGSIDAVSGEEAVKKGDGLDAKTDAGEENDEKSDGATATGVDVAVSSVAAVATTADQALLISPDGESTDVIDKAHDLNEAADNEPGTSKNAVRAVPLDGQQVQDGLPHVTTGSVADDLNLPPAAVGVFLAEDELVSADGEYENLEESDRTDRGPARKSHDRFKPETVDAVPAASVSSVASDGSANGSNSTQSDVSAAGSEVIDGVTDLVRTGVDERGRGEHRTNNVAASESSTAQTAATANGTAPALAAVGPVQTEAPGRTPSGEVAAIVRGGADDAAATSENAATGQARRSFAAGLSGRDSTEIVDGPRVDTARFVGRVARAFHFAQERGGTLQLRLSPPELGALRLELTVHEGVLSASLEAETPAARRLLLDNLPALREKLAEQNVRVERFDVDLRRDDREGQSGGFHDGRQQQQRDRGDWQNQTTRTADKGGPGQPIRTTVERPTTAVTNSSGINLVV
jgi:flagellar hook-length control protein FliK